MLTDFDIYGSAVRIVNRRDDVIKFPNGYKDQVKSLNFNQTGIVATAESDGVLAGGGELMIEESDDLKSIILYNHNAYQLNADSLNPLAGKGDVLLVQNDPKPKSRNLIVGAYGGTLYARRLNETEEHADVVVLTGHLTNPYDLPEPIIAPKHKIELKKIVGVIFLPNVMPRIANLQEVSEIESFELIKNHLNGVNLLQVKGRSMEPIALDGQYLITRREDVEKGSLWRLNGQLVIASDDSDIIYFKRLRLKKDLLVLESVNSSSTTSSEILSLSEGTMFPRLTNLESLVGVLFDHP